jgi:hypothetical protein
VERDDAVGQHVDLHLRPLTTVCVTFLLNSVGLVAFLVYLALAGQAGVAWLWLPPLIAVHFLFTLGLVILIAGLAVFLRDIGQLMGLLVPLWFYITPILYPLSMVPERFRWLIGINPMYPFIELYHQVLLRHRPAPGLAAAASRCCIPSCAAFCATPARLPTSRSASLIRRRVNAGGGWRGLNAGPAGCRGGRRWWPGPAGPVFYLAWILQIMLLDSHSNANRMTVRPNRP